MVPMVIDLVRPGSVVDVGCGTGGFLSVFGQHGIRDILGVDGDYLERSDLEIPAEAFLALDLTRPLHLDRIFDLVISLEVAEHLPPPSADLFVESLVRLGPVVLFSAAIPHQGGIHHLNEQWPDYWARRFANHGYVAFDCLREQIWNDQRVAWWYAQNTFLYLRKDMVGSYPAMFDARPIDSDDLRSLVHPQCLLQVVDWAATLMEGSD